uniref:Uncharacterized protein n=1 Tax=Plasmopara viticola lesion associated tombus-like virus 2 TaxID=2770119 RepID=A0A866UDB4_9TOMB|nr:hypothetical protein [Plasmopara viticola lesion associated tombus-like virus 2]
MKMAISFDLRCLAIDRFSRSIGGRQRSSLVTNVPFATMSLLREALLSDSRAGTCTTTGASRSGRKSLRPTGPRAPVRSARGNWTQHGTGRRTMEFTASALA